jgi:hypothetical protein
MKSTCLAAIFVLALPFKGSADIVYDVSLTSGADSVIGAITTDGTLGSISSANIVDWNLVLTGAGGPFTLTGPLSGNDSLVSTGGNDLTATSNDLVFNFSGGDGGWLFFEPPPFIGEHFFCVVANSSECNVSESIVVDIFQGDNQTSAQTGDVTIASAVPEPSAVTLLLTVLLGVAFVARKRIIRGTA